MLAPAVAAALTWPALGRQLLDAPRAEPAGLRAALWRGAHWAIAVYLLVAVLAGDPGAVPASLAGTPIMVILLLQVLGALGEEIAYRGALLSRY